MHKTHTVWADLVPPVPCSHGRFLHPEFVCLSGPMSDTAFSQTYPETEVRAPGLVVRIDLV